MTFDELDLSDDILDALDAMHFSECTPIQEQAIPAVLEGRDLIAVAQTGTGKTAAYLLPVIDRLASQPEPDAINCIVMSPTRELAQQIDRQMEGFSYFLPGVSYFILDEADRMLDMGFYDDIMQIVAATPATRQTLMFSATMPPKIKQMAQKILNHPAEVKIAVSRPADSIDQSAVVCHERQKTPILRHLFETKAGRRVIVFAASKLKVKELNRELRRAGYKSAEMHSDLEQDRRDEVMQDFRSARIDVLVATDILARGIDIDDIAMVVNYDVPREAEDYVHRIGRTARAGAGGSAVTLVGERDRRRLPGNEEFLGKPVRREDIPAEFGSLPEFRPDGRAGAGGGRKRRGGSSDKRRRGRGKKNATQAAEVTTQPVEAGPQPQSAAEGEQPKKKRRHRGGRRRRAGGKPQTPPAQS